MLIAIMLFLGISVGMLAGGVGTIGRESDIARNTLISKQNLIFAEGALEDFVHRARSGKQTPPSVTYTNGGNSATVTFVDEGATARVSARTTASEIVRAAESTLQADVGSVFNYAVHLGETGVLLETNAVINGSVYTNGSIEGYGNSEIVGDAYAVGTISSPSPDVSGVRQAGAANLPFAEVDTDAWKALANQNNDPYIGNMTLSGASSLGPRKIQGNLVLHGNARVTINGPLHVTGNLSMDTNSEMYLAETFGSGGTAIIVDGSISFDSNSNVFPTTASPKGYIMFGSLSTSGSAIDLDSNADVRAGVYAPVGVVRLDSNAHITSVTAKGLHLDSNAVLDYDLGIKNINYSGGPGGGWTVGSWGEVE